MYRVILTKKRLKVNEWFNERKMGGRNQVDDFLSLPLFYLHIGLFKKYYHFL